MQGIVKRLFINQTQETLLLQSIIPHILLIIVALENK
jgi:hypothetical protein